MAGIALGLIGSFPTPVTSSFESIATTTLGSTTSTITFSSIPSTYKSLQIRTLQRVDASVTGYYWNMKINVNSDSGSNYPWHYLQGDGSATSAAGTTATTYIEVNSVAPDQAKTSGIFGTSIIDIDDYASTTKNKSLRYFAGADANGTGKLTLGSGVWLNTSAITSISITTNAANGFIAGSTFSLYGIKGA